MVATRWSREALRRRWRRRLSISSKVTTDPRIITLVGICTAVAAGIVFDPPVPASGWKAAGSPAPAFKGVAKVVGPSLEAFKGVRPPLEAFKGVRPPLEAFKGVGPSLERSIDVVLVPDDAAKLHAVFRSIGYHLELVRTGHQPVPRVFVAALPSDMPRLGSVATRKAVFIKTVLPLILRVNEEILDQRRRLILLEERVRSDRPLSAGDSLWLERLAGRYGVRRGDLKELLLRVDAIPPSLALAQAAEESGWGTSRFAQEGNAMFGERTRYRGTPGMVPRNRPDGRRYKVKSFSWLLDGVRSYARNLNIHPAYGEFRRTRAALRRQAGEGAGVEGLKLAASLVRYSQRGADYVRALKTIMGANDLDQFDKARLSNDAAPRRFRTGI